MIFEASLLFQDVLAIVAADVTSVQRIFVPLDLTTGDIVGNSNYILVSSLQSSSVGPNVALVHAVMFTCLIPLCLHFVGEKSSPFNRASHHAALPFCCAGC